MAIRPKKSEISLEVAVWQLRGLSQEIRAIGHLIKWQQTEGIMDEDEQVGLGELLNRLSSQARQVADGIEKFGLKS